MWLHPDSVLTSSVGATYLTKFVGLIPITCSMRMLDFATRSMVAQHCITKMYQTEQNKNSNIKLTTKQKQQITTNNIADNIVSKWCNDPIYLNVEVIISITIEKVTLLLVSTGGVIHQFNISDISFTYTQGNDSSFVVFIVKNSQNSQLLSTTNQIDRVGVVLNCKTSEAASKVTTTLGQVFHLSFISNNHSLQNHKNSQIKQQNASTNLESKTASSSNNMEFNGFNNRSKDHKKTITKIDEPPYYNDLPGKMPPFTK